ncbi:MAG: sulfatase-like hydrolase/transferase [Verrucomicrobiota bacterium]
MKTLVALLLTTLSLAAEKPNILFIFADDHCFNAVHALGNDRIETPHLDQLVAQGTAFTNTYNMGAWNGAVCIASRTMLINGRTLWHAHQLYDKAKADQIVTNRETWPQILKDAGYQTYFTGKWHTSIQPDQIFDHVRNQRPGMPEDFPEGYYRPTGNGTDPWDPADPKWGGFWEGGKHWSEVVADDGIDYLNQAKDQDAPFFMYLAFNAPHDPRQAPKKFQNLYPYHTIPVPENFLPDYPHLAAMGMYPKKNDKGKPALLRDEALAPLPRPRYSVQANLSEYYAIITHKDHEIGRILQALDDSGKRDNTLIIFTADHGLGVGQHGLLGKQNMYEHSLKPPMILVGPGIPAGQTREQLVYLQDLIPTTLEYANLTPPPHIEFLSMLPHLNHTGESRDAVYGAYLKNRQRMIRSGDHKLILYPTTQTIRLFNLKTDPLEMNDLAKNPATLPLQKELFARLLQLAKEHNDPLALANTYQQLAK